MSRLNQFPDDVDREWQEFISAHDSSRSAPKEPAHRDFPQPGRPTGPRNRPTEPPSQTQGPRQTAESSRTSGPNQTADPAQSAGPRDWTPAPEVDDAFDPADLPQQDPAAPAAHSASSFALFIMSLLLLALCVVGMIGLLEMPRFAWIICGMGGILAMAGSVFFNAPTVRDPDDDGARL